MKTRTVEKGSHDFNPEHPRNPKLRLGKRKKREFSIKASLPKEAWFDTKEHGNSWLKLGGITYLGFNHILPNQNSLLVGFRPSTKQDIFEVCGYVNFHDKTWYITEITEVKADEEFTVNCSATPDDIIIYIINSKINILEYNSSMNNKLSLTGIQYNVSPYHGGSKVAPKTYSIKTQITNND